MNNKEFKDIVYKKYETYKCINNDDFFNKNLYKNNNKKMAINYISYILVFTFLITGVVYATTYYTKNIWNEPEEYIYEEEKKIKEEDREKTVNKEKAKKIAFDMLKSMEVEYEEISNIYMNKEPTLNRIEWVIEVDPEIDLRINAKNGKLISFSNNKLLNNDYNVKTSKNEAILISKKIIKKIKDSEKYEFSNISKIGGSQWQADYCIKYNGIFNPYQCIRITFDVKKEKLIMLNFFDYDFENNPFLIEKEKAIELVKIKDDSLEIVDAKKDIQMMNSLIYSKEYPPDLDKEYRTESIVRNVWNIEVIERKYGYKEKYFVDATTGEIIGGDMVK